MKNLNPKLNDNLFFTSFDGVEYYNLAPELVKQIDEYGNEDDNFDPCQVPDRWIFNCEEWEYQINVFAKNPPTEEEFAGVSWLNVANQIIMDFINARLSDGFHFNGETWLQYFNTNGKDMPYNQVLNIFDVAVFEAMHFDGLFDYLAGVIKALNRVSK